MEKEIVSNCCGAKMYSPDNESYTCMNCKEPCAPDDLSDDDTESDDNWQPCSDCDLPDACNDFGCAIEQGLRDRNFL